MAALWQPVLTAHDDLADLRLDGDVAGLLPGAMELAFGRGQTSHTQAG
jgi:hypothetical protein